MRKGVGGNAGAPGSAQGAAACADDEEWQGSLADPNVTRTSLGSGGQVTPRVEVPVVAGRSAVPPPPSSSGSSRASVP